MMRLAAASLFAFLLPAQQPTDLLHWLNAQAQSQLAQRKTRIRSILDKRDTAAARARRQEVRAKILRLIGGLPEDRNPLNARVTGRIAQSGYTIEKVIYESLPRYPVTANLYLPKSPGKHPAVLFPLGHWSEGKPAAQRVAANLALKGFVVLAFDPVGQGERMQAFDARMGRALGGGATDQHFMNGAQAELLGENIARYFIHDGMRGIDYLVSRPEVDAERIGVTGCSGGGTQTTYIAALDERVKAAAPACYMQSFELLFSGPVGDSEQTFPRFLAEGLDQTDYVELFAPKPWLILSTEGDFFTPAAAKLVYEEAKLWYAMMGKPENVAWVVGPGGHGTPKECREAIYAWFLKHLGGTASPAEQEVSLTPLPQLFATEKGQLGSEARELWEILRDEHARRRGTQPLEFVVKAGGAPPRVRVLSTAAFEGVPGENLLVETEPGFEIAAVLLNRGAAGKPAVFTVETGARVSARAVAMARAGHRVLALWPRGLPAAPTSRLAGDWITNFRASLIGRPLPVLRTQDIVRGVDLLKSIGTEEVRGVAQGVAGVWLLWAAERDGRIAKVWVDRTPHSFAAAFASPVHQDLYDVVLPGAGLRADLPAPGGRILWSDPTDWMRNAVFVPGNFYYRHFEEGDGALQQAFLK
jgi:hypothetical protein